MNLEANDLFITPHLGSDSLPKLIQDCLNVTKTPSTKDMLLLSLLTNCAYALPAMRCYHGMPRHEYGPELMTMVLAPAASGKGVMNYGRKLLRAIEGEKGKSVYIPANASSSALIALLQQFHGRGIMMATEMDTLSQTLRSGYGHFSDVIRCLFEHETIGQLRRQSNEFIEITNPHVSILLSGTFNQLAPFIRTRENGLMSRFACYVVTEKEDFMDEVWDTDDISNVNNENYVNYENNVYSDRLGALYLQQVNATHPCYFSLTDAQRQQIKRMFHTEYATYSKAYGPEFDQTLKRMPVIMKRIGMILTGLRLDPSQPLPEHVNCSADDFRTLLLIGHKLLMHAAATFDMLPPVTTSIPIAPAGSLMQKHFLDSLPQAFSKQDAEHLADTLGVSVDTMKRWLTNYVQSSIIQRVKQGEYQKISHEVA